MTPHHAGRPHVIVLGNEKGGSGKSTTAMHLVVALLHDGFKVGSIDCDARQGSFTRYVDNRKATAAGMLVPLGYLQNHMQSGLDDPALLRVRDAYLEVFGDVAPQAIFAHEFGHPIGGIVDAISVVTRPARHPVGAGPAVKQVVSTESKQIILSGIADNLLPKFVAGEVDDRRTRRICGSQELDRRPRGKCVGQGRVDRVGSAASGLGHDVADIINLILVVVITAGHEV